MTPRPARRRRAEPPVGGVEQVGLGHVGGEELEGDGPERPQRLDVLQRPAQHHLEADVDVDPAPGQRDLLAQLVRRRGPGLVGGHVEHGGDTAQRGGMGSGGEVLLVGEPGLAQVGMGVDEAGQHHAARRVDHLARGGSLAGREQRLDTAVPDRHRGLAKALSVHDGSAPDERVDPVSHGVRNSRGGRARSARCRDGA